MNRIVGGTGTYVLNTALAPKRVQVLRQLVPSVRLLGFLVNPNNSNTGDQIRLAQSAARTMDPELLVLNATMPRNVSNGPKRAASLCVVSSAPERVSFAAVSTTDALSECCIAGMPFGRISLDRGRPQRPAPASFTKVLLTAFGSSAATSLVVYFL